jgi:hypothetical protein
LLRSRAKAVKFGAFAQVALLCKDIEYCFDIYVDRYAYQNAAPRLRGVAF